MILVAGGTGRLGTLVVAALVGRGEPVRVLTRAVSRAEGLAGPLVEVVKGDVRDVASLRPAMAGVSTVVSAVHGFAGPGRVSPATVDRAGNVNLINAAGAENADVVLVSVVGAGAGHPMELFRMKAPAEQALRASGVPWTIIRAPAFLELYLELMRGTAGTSGRPLIFGRGQNPVPFVPVADVADAVVQAVLDPTQRRHTITVGGAALRTLTEVAAMAQQELGLTNKPARHLPRPVLRVLAGTRVVADTAVARQAQAALIMDTADSTSSAIQISRGSDSAGSGTGRSTP